jgi:hypothetical protein
MVEISRLSAAPDPYSPPRPRRVQGLTTRAIDARTALRAASVDAESEVAAEKLHALDRLASVGMTGQLLLAHLRATLAGSDPLLDDELKLFTDVAKLGKAEVIADVINRFQQR